MSQQLPAYWNHYTPELQNWWHNLRQDTKDRFFATDMHVIFEAMTQAEMDEHILWMLPIEDCTPSYVYNVGVRNQWGGGYTKDDADFTNELEAYEFACNLDLPDSEWAIVYTLTYAEEQGWRY